MSHSQLQATPARTRSPYRRLRWVLGVVVLAVGSALGIYAYLTYAVEREIRDAIAEADRLDPGWRFEEMEAARPTIPDGENSAVLIAAAFAKIPAKWPGQADGVPRAIDRLAELVLPDLPPDAEAAALRGERAQVADALAIARQIADRPRGRHMVPWSEDLIGTPADHLTRINLVVQALIVDAAVRALDGDADGAVRSCHAALNAARSVGDEPLTMSQMFRAQFAVQSVRALERTLAYGAAKPEVLETLQRACLDEADAPSHLIAARSWRAGLFRPLELMRSGRFNRSVYRMMPSRLGEGFDARVDATRARTAEAAHLRHMNALVEIARLPPEKQAEQFQQLARPTQPLPVLIEALTRDVDWLKLAQKFHRTEACLRCTAAALAAERYRLAEQRWPDRLDALVPRYLPAVPRDPFTGEPLRLRRLADGITIYSVNADRVDDGGKLDRRQPDAPGTDLGIQFWDSDQRAMRR